MLEVPDIKDIIRVNNWVAYQRPVEEIRDMLLEAGYSDYGAWLCYHAGKTYHNMNLRDTASFSTRGKK